MKTIFFILGCVIYLFKFVHTQSSIILYYHKDDKLFCDIIRLNFFILGCVIMFALQSAVIITDPPLTVWHSKMVTLSEDGAEERSSWLL